MREFCPALTNKAYFNYGGQGPLPKPSLDAITASWKRIQDLGPFTNNVWDYISNEQRHTRQQLAELCGVSPHRLALSENVTSGCVVPLLGLPFEDGDRLLISDCEHPGVVAACTELARRHHLLIDTLPVKLMLAGAEEQHHTNSSVLEAVERFLRPSTRLVVLSHLLWNTGQIMPISSLAERLRQHKRQPFLLVDAAQSFGQLDVRDAAAAADIYAFTGHKWACGPEGLGGVAVSERLVRDSRPALIGWRSLRDGSQFNSDDPDPFHNDSRRFEVATSCVPLLAGLRASLDLLEHEGQPAVRLQRIRARSNALWQVLEEISGVKTLLQGPPAAGIVSFTLRKRIDTGSIVQRLGAQGVWIRNLVDPDCLRACTHLCTTEAELIRLSTALASLISGY